MADRRRGFPALPFLLAAVFLGPFAAAAADPEPTPGEKPIDVPSFPAALYRQWSVEDVEPKPESREYVKSRDDTLERLALRAAVAIALENHPGIAVERLGPSYAAAEVDRAYGVFDPRFTAFGLWNRNVTPSSSSLAGALAVRQRQFDAGSEIDKLVRTGATFSVAFESNETDSNSRFVGLRPQYKPQLTFSVTQPLLKNFGLGLTILLVRSAEAGSNVAYHLYESKVVALVRQVIEAYWGVVQAKENLKAQQDGLAFADNLVKENEARVRAGVLPPIAVKEAQADAASREEQVISAKNALDVATERLRLFLQRNPEGAFLPRPIEPADSPEVRTVETNEEEILANAISGRPEILQARYDIENKKILARVKENNLLPQLDASGSYGVNGLSGRGVPQVDFRTGQTSVTPFTGDYGDSLDRMWSNRYNSYSAGVTLSLPLSNAAPRAEYVESRIDVRRAELSYRQLLSDVTLEVRKAIGDVRANSKRITATRLARELAEENLEQQHKRYAVGLATTKDILDFQEKVTTARAAEIRALIDYNVSLAALRQSEGTLLRQFDVVLERGAPPSAPIWARF